MNWWRRIFSIEQNSANSSAAVVISTSWKELLLERSGLVYEPYQKASPDRRSNQEKDPHSKNSCGHLWPDVHRTYSRSLFQSSILKQHSVLTAAASHLESHRIPSVEISFQMAPHICISSRGRTYQGKHRLENFVISTTQPRLGSLGLPSFQTSQRLLGKTVWQLLRPQRRVEFSLARNHSTSPQEGPSSFCSIIGNWSVVMNSFRHITCTVEALISFCLTQRANALFLWENWKQFLLLNKQPAWNVK